MHETSKMELPENFPAAVARVLNGLHNPVGEFLLAESSIISTGFGIQSQRLEIVELKWTVGIRNLKKCLKVVENIFSLQSWSGCCGQVVSVLALNPTVQIMLKPTVFSVKFVFEKTENE